MSRERVLWEPGCDGARTGFGVVGDERQQGAGLDLALAEVVWASAKVSSVRRPIFASMVMT